MFVYREVSSLNTGFYWTMFLSLILCGIGKLVLTQMEKDKSNKIITEISLVIHILTVLLLGMAGEAYAVTVAFLLLILKGILLFKM